MIMAALELRLNWLDPFVAYLSDGSLPNDVKEANKVRITATRFWLSGDGRLYRRSFGGPYLLCLHPSKTADLLVEFMEGYVAATWGAGHSHTVP